MICGPPGDAMASTTSTNAHQEMDMATVEKSQAFAAPGQEGSLVEVADRYENFIGGGWVAPAEGKYRENLSPVNGEP